ncbi:MAG TPA: methyltransferase domain-containing protein [Longimicrobiales bacterium]
MTRLARLEHAHERMDAPDVAPDALEASLDDVAAVNRWLGGTRALLRRLPALLPPAGPARILDAGTGSGDLPRAIVRWAHRHGHTIRVTAADRHAITARIARERSLAYPEITVEEADVRRLPHPDGAFDVALLSLTLHHLEEPDQIAALRELGRVATRGILVGELERNWSAYLGARLLAATVWRHNPITRHDGPVSVLRAFTPGELLELAHRAGLPTPRVYRHPFFRLVLTAGASPSGTPPPRPGPLPLHT